MDDAPDPRYVPDVEGPVEPEVSPQPGNVLRPQRRVQVDAWHIGAAGAVHQHERDQRHAQHDDEGGEEPPGHVLREHQLLDVKPGGSWITSVRTTCHPSPTRRGSTAAARTG